MVQQSQQLAVQHFVDSLRVAADVKVENGAAGQVKDMAKNGPDHLSSRAAGRKLATFKGGQLTAGDLQGAMAGAPAEALKNLSEAPDSSVNSIIKDQAVKKVLLAEALRRHLGPTPQDLEGMRQQARATVHQLVEVTGLAQRRAPKGSAGNAVIEQVVREMLQKAVTGQAQMPPLGALGAQLRAIYRPSVNAESFPKVIARVRSIRATQPPVPAGARGPQSGMPPPGHAAAGNAPPGRAAADASRRRPGPRSGGHRQEVSRRRTRQARGSKHLALGTWHSALSVEARWEPHRASRRMRPAGVRAAPPALRPLRAASLFIPPKPSACAS